jgi:adenine specific DNA methylase Mod
MNIHLSIYPESREDVIKAVLGFIRANNFPYLYHQWFDTDKGKNEVVVSSYSPNAEIERLFVSSKWIDGVEVEDDCYRFGNGKYYIITF